MRTATGKRRAAERREAYENGDMKPQGEKWCKLCDKVLSFESFYIRFDYDGLLSHYCRKCLMYDSKLYKRRRRARSTRRT